MSVEAESWWRSGFSNSGQEISEDNCFTKNRQIARDSTQFEIEQAFSACHNKVVRSPPGTGKTYSVLEAGVKEDRTVVIGFQTYSLVEEKKCEVEEEHDGTALSVKSAYECCPCYTGEHGEELADQLREITVSPARLHQMSESNEVDLDLLCNDNNCPYIRQFDQDLDSADVVLTTHQMLQATSLTEDRHIVIDEFNLNAYVTEIENPRGVVNHYLDFIGSPFGVWGEAKQVDSMAGIQSHLSAASDAKEAWDRECIMAASEGRSNTHTDADLLVKALLHGEQSGQYIHYQHDSYTDVLITTDSAKVLHRPNTDDVQSVVGLDATASELLWQKFVDKDIEVSEPVTDEEQRILWKQSGGELTLVGNYAQHADGGNISVAPTEHAQQVINSVYEETFTFSTKTVKDQTSIGVDAYYGRDDKGTNDYGEADALLLVGSPHPGDGVIRETAAWFGENVLPPSRDNPQEMGVNLDYGSEIANEIFEQFRESRVEQAIYRGNRMDGSGLAVLSTTACVPDWMPVLDELPMPRTPGEKEQAVLDALEELESATTREVVEHVTNCSDAVDIISPQHVRRVATKYTRLGLIQTKQNPVDKRGVIYEFGGLSISEIPENLANIVCSEFLNDSCSESMDSIQQTVEHLMELSWSNLDWAEWIAQGPRSGADTAVKLT